MTELELFYHYVPDIAEIIVGLRGQTAEQRQNWKRGCLEYADGLSFASGFIRKTVTCRTAN